MASKRSVTMRINVRPTCMDVRRVVIGRQRNEGVALITALIILILVFGLGVSSLFLANVNIQTTENVRSQAIARNAAETGLDVARLALQSAYRTNLAFPSTFSVPTIDGLQYEIVAGSYAVTTDPDRVEIEILGTEPNGARFTMSANMIAQFAEGTGGDGTPGDGFPGLLSESRIQLSGGGVAGPVFRDMQIHANNQVDVRFGSFERCSVERAEDGSCPGVWEPVTFSGPTDPDYPISTEDGSNCVTPRPPGPPRGGAQCVAGGEKTVNPAYDQRLYNATGTALYPIGHPNEGTVNMLSAECARADTLCTTGNVTFSADSIPEKDGVPVSRIIADGNITVTGSGGRLEDMLLVSTQGGVTFPSSYTIEDVRVFSNNSLEFGNDFAAFGEVTLASRGATSFASSESEGDFACSAGVKFQGQSPAIQDGQVTFLVVSEQCIKVAGGPWGDTSGFFIAEGNFKYAGSPGADFTGGAAARGEIKFAGTALSPKFDAYLELQNQDSIGFDPDTGGDPVVSIIVMR